jgi:EAL domain-containing protein (putative c-di-GMP-specific phosphodiesterase class I)
VRPLARRRLPVSVAVNISPRNLLGGDLPSTVLDALAEAGLPAAFLELEITETAITTDPARAAAVLAQLHTIGLRTAIDDFGAGYTSLAFLKALPVHQLKIDRGFVIGVLDDPNDQAIVEAVIALGHSLGLSVLAEGVEIDDIRARLDQLGCDEIQGCLLAQPLPPEQVEGWLTAWNAQEAALASSRQSRATGHTRRDVVRNALSARW